ncbi:efflux RND transporter permease subunit [Alcaligenes faecalis]|uniref:efflux RND transporter permease subunit n=1 Tax=Alcaligenes TaxID=507 RepID=UPI0005AA6EA8|nr:MULTISPECIES: multidrug efflux RND transporter permease subunit [Alcaligenes]ATI01720.1 multidrug efflux RND transporter permease subunit [Alcaligenes faecalis]AYZ93522.1 multidrug efflux RND transporter permease subunit [Alcaligenes faecalis]KVX05203.1 transporter [Alcaligenes faecalis]MCX5596364.1 multidrug efflux RND transporter permease subunit [Alcaligenes faecalis]MDT0218549.1 multidrug efflux RND transporter permease subunit [Alcaligenes sp. AB3]
MNFSKFFIDRPIFAAVMSIVIFIGGLIAIPSLPISEYPEVVPPAVMVRTVYPGANPKVIAETVATPLEEAINGVENMMYMKSVAGSDGVLQMTVTFEPGTDPDDAAVKVQNRVAQAQARLPEDVRRQGVTVQKQSPVFLMVVHLTAEDDRYDTLYLRNYMRLHVKDAMARIPGVGDAQQFGGGDYAMRIWLDPDKVAARGLTASDVLRAVREQNIQVSAGQLGAEPMPNPSDFLLPINAKGRLESVEEFGDIVLKSGAAGEIVRLADVARIELAAGDYTLRARLDGKSASAIGIFQAPGANALEIRDAVVAKMEDIRQKLPPGIEIQSIYDTTVFVRDSIKSVITTLLEAVLLVILVVILFLQTWRASIIPLLAVPVSIIGTFAVLHVLGFSINTLTLFGLVLAIGIVVDDAIVVVENVERHIENGEPPLQAAHLAMREVSGPIIAITLVLCAVFIPMAFLDGVIGEFYKQFAVAIAISVAISGLNSLTLSPALAARLLKPHDAPKDALTRGIDRAFGWLFVPFNRMFQRSAERYQSSIGRVLGRRGVVMVVYVGLLAATGLMFNLVPSGFIPVQDKQYLIAGVKMPEGASIERTDVVLKRMTEIAMKVDGVSNEIAFPGLNPLQFTNTPNNGVVFYVLEPFSERSRSAEDISAELNQKFAEIQEGLAFAFMPPPIQGLGNGSGWSLFIQDREQLGYGSLQQAVQAFQGAVVQTPGMAYPISSYQANVPQLDAVVDRIKAKAQGVPLTELFDTLQTYLGSSYVNDFNMFGRTWQVIAQADGAFRASTEDISRLRTRNDQGEMVPIGSLLQVQSTYGPDPVIRFNGYPAADLLGDADPRVLSSGQAMAYVEQLASQVLPAGMGIGWSDLSYQQANQSGAAMIVFPMAVLLVFLVLAALYESWTLPLAVILIVPMCLLAALFGVWLTNGDNNVFVQVGLVVLMGLACKNAILIIEFARELEQEGLDIVHAALQACRLRLRPIVMTSIAFCAGVAPLMVSSGAGSEVRAATGITVFAGMVGVTAFGLFLTPAFYVALRKLASRSSVQRAQAPIQVSHD